MGKQFFTVLFCFLGFCVLQAQNQVDILIIDGGAGGTSAGIQAARMGTKVQIIEANTLVRRHVDLCRRFRH